jgi:hypothetical protein
VAEGCAQCEEHAVLHRGNWLGIGPQEDCPQCLAHVELHKQERRVRWW